MGDARKGRLFVISGPSGTGKGAICDGLVEIMDVTLSVSMTTRAPREGEREGKSYYFVDTACFEQRIAEDGFFEYAEIYGAYYGTPKEPVTRALDDGRDVILEIEMQGAAQVGAIVPNATLVFILPPSLEELRKRIESRGAETAERIAHRLGRAESEIALLEKYDYYVINDELGSAIKDVCSIISAKRLASENRSQEQFSPYETAAVRRAEELRVGADARELISRYKLL